MRKGFSIEILSAVWTKSEVSKDFILFPERGWRLNSNRSVRLMSQTHLQDFILHLLTSYERMTQMESVCFSYSHIYPVTPWSCMALDSQTEI